MQDDPILHHDAIAYETIARAEERLRVDRLERVTGRVRVSIGTEIIDEPIHMDLSRTEMRVETVSVDRMLEPGEAPPVQSMRGETTVIPVLEEVIVVEKRLVLRAEIHVTPVTSSEPLSTSVPLRRQTVTIDRLPSGEPAFEQVSDNPTIED